MKDVKNTQYYANSNLKREEITVLISDETHFKAKKKKILSETKTVTLEGWKSQSITKA